MTVRRDALALWKQVHTRLKELDTELGPYNRDDVIAGVAAAIVVAVAEGKNECSDEILQHSANTLVEVAMSITPATAQEDGYRDRGATWSVGSDRSAAAALPLFFPRIAQRDVTCSKLA